MKTQRDLSRLAVAPQTDLLSAMKRMDDVRSKLLLVLRDGAFCGLVSIGDIQRAIIQNRPMTAAVETIMRKEIVVCRTSDTQDHIRNTMTECRAAFMPILDDHGHLADVVFWEDLFTPGTRLSSVTLDLPVVIMAGGMGTRLRPLTNVLPKPLLPMGGTTIIETIIDRFARFGCSEFFVSLNYKADLVRYYLTTDRERARPITFFEEDRPLGTAGSLSLIKDQLTSTFIVTNCDILIEQDMDELVEYHRQSRNDLTVVAAVKHLKLPYGSLQTGQRGALTSLEEKPEMVFKINTGVYILEPSVLTVIPENAHCNMTEVIGTLLAQRRPVGVFPVSEGAYTDIGSWDAYLRILTAQGMGSTHAERSALGQEG